MKIRARVNMDTDPISLVVMAAEDDINAQING